MRKLFSAFALAILLLLGVRPGFAQDATVDPSPVVTEEAPPPVVEPPVTPVDQTAIIQTVLVIAGAIVVVAFGVFGYVVRPAIVGAVNGMPEWAANILLTGGDIGLDALEDYVKRTPSPVDDNEVAKLRQAFEDLAAEIRASRPSAG